MRKIGYGSSIDNQGSWKYEIIDETISGKYVVKAIKHERLGLFLLDKGEIHDISEEEEKHYTSLVPT